MNDGVITALQKARALVSDLAAGRKTFTMSVPANHERDSDLIICDAIDLALETIRIYRDGDK